MPASSSVSVSGTAGLVVGSGFNFTLTLGTLASPGMVIQNGTLESLTVTADVSNATLAGATFAATGLGLTYVPASGSVSDSFTGFGSAGLTLKNGSALSLTLGTVTAPGLTISQDAVTGLNATGNINMTLAGATFSAQNVAVTYVAATNSVSVSGTASLEFPKGPSLTLTLGSGTAPGLMFSNGALTSLNASASFSMTLAGATFSGENIDISYVPASGSNSDSFTASGSTSLVLSQGPTIGLTIGTSTSPGLVLSGGTVTSLVGSADFTMSLAGPTFTANPVNLTYVAASGQTPASFDVSGTASLDFPTGGLQLTLNLSPVGESGQPGLIFTNGALASLSARRASA